MEILLFHFNLIPMLLFFFLLFIVVRKRKNMITNGNQRLLPPGPWKLPLIGSLHHLIGELPHHALRNLARKYGPLMHLQLGEVHAVVVSSPHLAKQFLKVHDHSFAARPELMASDIIFYRQKDIVFAKYGDYWKHMRKICISELLSAKMVKSFSLIRQDEVHNLVTSIRSTPNAVVNMTEKALRLTSSVICRSAFGKIWEDRDNLLLIMSDVVSLSGGFDVADLFPSWILLHEISGMRNRLMSMHQKIDVILENIINEHKDNQANGKKGNGEFGGEDLIDVLLRVMENLKHQYPMTNDNIKAVILDMFFGGTETSSAMIQWAFSELMKNPNVMAKAQEEVRKTCKGKKDLDDNDLEELKYLKLVIKETLRLHPASPLLGLRECRKETEIDGYTIPLKATVIVNGWTIGRDPESWDDPENFVPERFENSSVDFNGNHFQLIPFGAGSRMCPGMHFGLASVVYPLAQLLYHFDWDLPYGLQPDDLDMTETCGISASRKNHLHLIAIPHDLSQH
ncbi:premnaspirodiene oxygenase-like [Lycium ferocissimum]|uniref:premnaspirodiene oxygenase-like n=1 Tax=Lycium ferocissimum TaxID=112874 RepID=UPI00281657E4|nr:premnaspirodiene oxygenase-like [Lycium ferocissimum]